MPILCYHTVEPTWSSVLALTPRDFERHAEWLSRHRRVLDLADALNVADASWRLPKRTVALTFDDGFAGLYRHAFPVLKRYRLPVIVFLVARTLEEPAAPIDWVDGSVPAEVRALTPDEVSEMHGAGVRFGSHSYAHRDLTLLGEDECERDLRRSRELLEDHLHSPVPFLAYPRGLHNERVRHCAARAGFSHAFALPETHEVASTYSIPRVGIYRGNGTLTLRAKTLGWYLQARTRTRRHRASERTL